MFPLDVHGNLYQMQLCYLKIPDELLQSNKNMCIYLYLCDMWYVMYCYNVHPRLDSKVVFDSILFYAHSLLTTRRCIKFSTFVLAMFSIDNFFIDIFNQVISFWSN